ncbi:MAG TPA: hypothetical protein VLB90_01030 [Pseudomonadales bacterium]|nr:hypothetical protein [Pseudomonadales bacterium]
MTPQNNQYRLLTCTTWEKSACILLIAGSLAYYWSVFFYYALDAGQADDFVDVLWFFEIFLGQEHWLDKLAVIALPNHEHVTIFNHLVYLAHYALFKQINFFHYMLIGHFLVLACCWVLAEWLQKTVGWWYALALVFTVFFNLFYWHASFWAMTALSNQAVILFALLAARSVARNPDAIVKPLSWALLAVTTQFNGLLVLPALIASGFLVKKVEHGQQNWRQLLVWLGAFIVVTVSYITYENPFNADHLWRYVVYTDPQNLKDYINPVNENDIAGATSLWNAPLTLLSMAGASVVDLTQWWLAAMVGGALLFFLLLGGVRPSAVSDRFWWAILFFVGASIALVAIGRGLSFGPEAGLLYRYRIYSFLLLILLVGSTISRKPNRMTVWFFLLTGLFVQIVSLHVLDDIDRERVTVKTSHYNWLIDGGMGRSHMPFYPHNQDWRLFNAYERGDYNPYNAIDSRHRPVFVSAVKDGACGLDAASPVVETGVARAWSKKPRALAAEITLDTVPSDTPAQLLFCGNAVSYLFMLDAHNIDRDTGKYSSLLVLKKQLPPSQYRVLLQQSDGSYKSLGNIAFP